MPDLEFRLAPDSLSRGRNCSTPCQTCDFGTCQNDGTCLCDYGYLWQGPLTEDSDVGYREAIVPFPASSGGPTAYAPEYHNCSARHPCSFNGEYFNATCGAHGNGTIANISEWRQERCTLIHFSVLTLLLVTLLVFTLSDLTLLVLTIFNLSISCGTRLLVSVVTKYVDKTTQVELKS